MPVYEYACTGCGSAFDALVPLARRQEPAPCPDCGHDSDRVFMTAPALSALTASARQAHATNERSRHEPRSTARHGMSCMCCKPKAKADASPKAFPNARPWMISH